MARPDLVVYGVTVSFSLAVGLILSILLTGCAINPGSIIGAAMMINSVNKPSPS